MALIVESAKDDYDSVSCVQAVKRHVGLVKNDVEEPAKSSKSAPTASSTSSAQAQGGDSGHSGVKIKSEKVDCPSEEDDEEDEDDDCVVNLKDLYGFCADEDFEQDLVRLTMMKTFIQLTLWELAFLHNRFDLVGNSWKQCVGWGWGCVRNADEEEDEEAKAVEGMRMRSSREEEM
jgi:hypothetical protein